MAKKNTKKRNSRQRRSRWSFRDVAGIALITIALLAAVAILSFDPLDPPGGTLEPVANHLGIAGSWIAWALINFTFGRIFSLVIPFLLMVFALDLIRGRGYRRTVRIGAFLLILALLVVTSWEVIRDIMGIRDPNGDMEITGFAGFVTAGQLQQWLGRTGSVITLTGLSLIFLTIVLGIRWAAEVGAFYAILEWLGRMLRSLRPRRPLIRQEKKLRVKRKPPDEPPAVDENDEEPGDGVVIVKDAPFIPAPRGTGKKAVVPRREEMEGDPSEYVLPPIDLLSEPPGDADDEPLDDSMLRSKAALLEESFEQFGVQAKVIQIHPGPVVTRFDLKPAPGVKVGKITALADDLALVLAAPSIRIQAPIPGAGAVGIEIPNKGFRTVYIRELIESPIFRDSDKPLMIALGRTAQGDVFVTDLAMMPHLLIAGTTGAGKSVCINSIIASILMRNRPDEVMIAMVDPKKLELSAYGELRKHHLLFLEDTDEVIATEPKNAVLLLKSVVQEMENRYTRLAETGARNIVEYNKFISAGKVRQVEGEEPLPPLPYIVVIIDELADLMLTAARDVEEPIARLAQMSRAVGIHLVVATQRPSVDVITGVIKANFPARLAFMVASKIDSRTILDRAGAETLLGRGDSLLLTSSSPHPLRLHGAFITTGEVHQLIAHVARQPAFIKRVQLEPPAGGAAGGGGSGLDPAEGRDVLFEEAVRLVVRHQQGSVSLLQRRLKVGYSRAGRLLDQLEQAGVVGPFEGSKAREVLVQPEDLEEFLR